MNSAQPANQLRQWYDSQGDTAETAQISRAHPSLRMRQLPGVERFERVLNEFLQTAACRVALGFALQRNDSSDNSTSFREHFTHNGTLGK